MERVENSIGIPTLDPNAARSVPSRYHREITYEDMPHMLDWVVRGLGDLADGYEFAYLGEGNEGDLERIMTALGQHIVLGLFCDLTAVRPSLGMR